MNDTPGSNPPGPSPAEEPPDHDPARNPAPTPEPGAPSGESAPGTESPASGEGGRTPADAPAGIPAPAPPPAPAPIPTGGWAGWGAPPPPPPGGMPPYPAAPYPYPSVPQPQPGWGGWGLPQQRGWGGFGWGVPPAPQPGVIPLRPLTVGEILQGAARAARRHWRTMAGLLAAIGVLSGITGLAYDAVSIGDHTFNGHRHRLSGHELDHLLTFGGIAGGCELLLVVLGVIATAVFTGVFARSALGQPSDWRGAWGQARPRLGAVCGITLLLIAIAVGFPLLGAVPGIVVAAVGGPVAGAVGLSVLGVFLGLIPAARLLVLYSLSIQTCVLEKHGVRRSLSRSASLVRGSWWRVFGIQLLGGLLVTLVRSLINVPFVAVGLAIFGVHLHTTAGNPDVTFFASYSWGQAVLSAIGTAIGAALTSQYVSGVTSFLYMDQRIRRESLDVELARAAGVPGYSA